MASVALAHRRGVSHPTIDFSQAYSCFSAVQEPVRKSACAVSAMDAAPDIVLPAMVPLMWMGLFPGADALRSNSIECPFTAPSMVPGPRRNPNVSPGLVQTISPPAKEPDTRL